MIKPPLARLRGELPFRYPRMVCAIGAALLAVSCSADSERLRVPPGDHKACQAGTFIGEMTGNCPQLIR